MWRRRIQRLPSNLTPFFPRFLGRWVKQSQLFSLFYPPPFHHLQLYFSFICAGMCTQQTTMKRGFSTYTRNLLLLIRQASMISVIRFREDSGKRLTRSADGNVNFSSTYYDYRLSADNYSVGRSSRGELHTKLCWSHGNELRTIQDVIQP